jgi:outer membrane autotransporter protein
VEGTVLASALKKDTGSSGGTSGAKARMAMAAKPAASSSVSIADFKADHFEAYGMSSLFFKTYGLGVKDSDRADTKDYTKDLYITGVTNHTTNEHGQYTPTVSTALSGSSLMYYTWRTENDKMLQRVGDLRENEGEETGLWARIRGSRIGKSHSDRGFKNQYKVYEIGYDAKTEDNDRMKSFTGIAFSYLDGMGYYTDGRGTNQATSAAIYHTDIHKTGHYLDLVFRIRHMNERLHTHTTVDADIGPITEDHSASMDTTGLSFSAEYGRKKFMGNGWYVEPQTQWTLGYLGPNQYEMDNGTRVEQPGITSFVGRVGFNLGRQVNPNSIVYLKANVYHEFGGHSPIHLYAGDESLSFTDTFDDTWFEYGVGFAMKLGSRLSLYGDFEKSAGSHFYKDWQWNAGIRYSF